jgi:pimeloyl-ACP methyl ester carboxylesterase
VNVFAFDYRGYGQSQFMRPSEAHWREDAEWALQYLESTRHIAAASIVVDGDELGADLALDIAAAHPELAGVVVRNPIPDAANAIFNDARARLVPARVLVSDRYDLNAAATALRIPSLWLCDAAAPGSGGTEPAAFRKAAERKMLVWLGPRPAAQREFGDAVSRWLGDVGKR